MRLAAAALLLVVSGCAERKEASAPAPTAPTAHTWSSKAGGCGDISLHLQDTSGTAFLVVNASRARLGLKKQGDAKTVDLASERPDAKSLFVDVYARAGANENYCSDVQTGDFKAKETFLAVRGRLTLTLGEVRSDGDFDVTMKLEGVIVRNAKGAEEVIPDANFGPIKVGWLPG